MIQEGLNCLEMTDYFFTNIEPKPIIVERPPAHHSTSTSHQPLNGDKVTYEPQQPIATSTPWATDNSETPTEAYRQILPGMTSR